MSEKHLHISVLLMVKNEHKRLHVTLESIKNFADSLVLYDTGSTDDTIRIARNFCEQNNIPLRLKEGEFIDFSISRNVSLDFADTFYDIDFIVLMDTNDELRESKQLRKFCEEYKDKPNTGFMICQEWWSGKYDTYYNLRMIKPRQGWRYRGRVHEWMENTKFESEENAQDSSDTIIRVHNKIVLYQDRTQDDDKSSKRFFRDKVLLLEDHKDDPSNPRIVFYLAQTCNCLNHLEDAYYYYNLRTTLEGFWEERFHAFLKCGELTQKLQRPWHESMKWYINAFEYTPRVEPLIEIINYYKDKNWLLCYTFASLACNLSYPEHCILFVDKHAYNYTRWHLLGIAGWYAGFYNEGKMGCQKAIAYGFNVDIDTNNLKYYEDKELIDFEEANKQIINKEIIDIAFQQINLEKNT